MTIYEFLLKMAEEHPLLSALALLSLASLGRIGSHRTAVERKN